MMERKKIYYLYWALPILFLLWELFFTELLVPIAFALMTIGKYIYITICYLLRKKPTAVLVLTIILIIAFLAIDYALYLPFSIEVENAAPHQVRLFHFIIGIITYCPFLLCVYYLIRKMGRAT